ncbi:uncharacterized protein [Ptychodera flava]|uniref:uncharacterized protein n=1 Tax=Ptychodera flava TaxID=63121 RepID=UPI00396A9D0F
MCIIQDGMDQKKTAIPRLVNEDKMTSLLARIRLHITGNIIHTNVPGGKIIPAYVDLLNYPHDSNLSMHLLLQTLFDNRARLSRCLFTQLDNCYRENKNRYMLSLAHVLVQYKVFDMVDLHFLLVGHTHEDIDQLFSCISRHLKKTNIYTMDDMERAVMNSYNVPVFVKHVEGVFDIKKWLLPHMVKNFKGQSKPLHFQFKEFDGKVRMRYRHRSTSNRRPVLQFKDDDFTPIEEPKGLICLKTLPNVDDVPEWVKPSIEKMDPERLRKDLPDAYQGRITCERDKQWLREFAQNINDHAKAPSSRPQRWFLHDFMT